jgi:hypothetical protein
LRRRSKQLFLILILTAPLLAQQEPTFQTQSNVVLVPALVRDQSGEIVYGLQAKDFVIEDNGVEQAIRLDEAAEAEPLSLMIAIQTGRKAEHEFPKIRGLKSMLDPIFAQEGSQIAIVTFDSQIQLAQDFTGDASKVDSALEHLRPGDDGAVILNTVNYCVGLLLISEKRDYGSKAAILDHVITLIGASNTTIYSLIFSPSFESAKRRLRGKDEGPAVDVMSLLDLARAAMKKNTSKAIADQTGGEFELFDSRSSFESRIIDFTNHLHSRYLLSFQPSDPQPGLHRITVRLKQPADNSVLARSTYWARGPGTE